MDSILQILSRSRLFEGIDPDQIEAVLGCLAPVRRSYARGETILEAQTETDSFGLVLRGGVMIVQTDYWGNRNIMAVQRAGDLFAESFAAQPDMPINVRVEAAEDCEALFFNLRRVLTNCPRTCAHHRQLIENLLMVISNRNRQLNEKIAHISQRTTRRKILSYLSAQARAAGSAEFEIPFSRQQMADYLSVDRSALSAELSRLKAEGLLDYHRNAFCIMRSDEQEENA